MNRFLTIFTALITFFSIPASAQYQGGIIAGKILDVNKNPVSATVTLMRLVDSSLVQSTAADAKGEFLIAGVSDGDYFLKTTAIGYETYFSEKLEKKKEDLNLQAITLKLNSQALDAVTVVSRKPMIEQKIDRMVVNVDAAVTNTGSNALEVLEKSPGIQVDKDGNISLKGKQGVIVMLDGRPSYLTGPELANLLRGMQASQLETIEIMTNPPAKYDAAGNSGVINIKTKKNKARGFNGSLTVGYGQGVYAKTNESINLNYRKNKVNIFGTYSYGGAENFQQLDIFRRYKNDDNSVRAIFEQVSIMKSKRSNNNLKVGMDYNLTGKTTLGIVVSGFYNPEDDKGQNTSFLKNPLSSVDSIVNAASASKELWKNGSINLNMRHMYDSTGRELTTDIDYVHYNAMNEQSFTNTTFTNNWIKKYDEKLLGDLPVKIDIYSAKVDYTHPISKETKLELGLKTSYVVTENRANYFEYLNDSWVTDYRKTNFFNYEENVNAVYANLSKQITKKIGMQAGLRFENTNYEGYQYGNPTKKDSSFKKTYNNLFPTVYFSYAADKQNQFGLSIGRRIDRPRYQDLNPFLFFIDKYTYNQGNPYLLPQYSNNIEASHIFKGVLTTTVNYSYTKNLFVETFDQPESQQDYDYATIVRRGNIGKRENAGVAFNVQLPVTKWFTSMIYTNYNYTKFEGMLNGEMVEAEAGNVLLSLNNQFRFNKGWSAEISGWYRSKGVESQIRIQAMGQLSAGIAKQILKGKGSLKLNVRDLLYTGQVKGDMNFKSTEVQFRNRRDSRVANITFSYRFGKALNGNTQRKKGSASEEQNRVSSGD